MSKKLLQKLPYEPISPEWQTPQGTSKKACLLIPLFTFQDPGIAWRPKYYATNASYALQSWKLFSDIDALDIPVYLYVNNSETEILEHLSYLGIPDAYIKTYTLSEFDLHPNASWVFLLPILDQQFAVYNYTFMADADLFICSATGKKGGFFQKWLSENVQPGIGASYTEVNKIPGHYIDGNPSDKNIYTQKRILRKKYQRVLGISKFEKPYIYPSGDMIVASKEIYADTETQDYIRKSFSFFRGDEEQLTYYAAAQPGKLYDLNIPEMFQNYGDVADDIFHGIPKIVHVSYDVNDLFFKSIGIQSEVE